MKQRNEPLNNKKKIADLKDYACVSSTNLKYLSFAQQLNPSACLIKSDSFDKMAFYAIREYIHFFYFS